MICIIAQIRTVFHAQLYVDMIYINAHKRTCLHALVYLAMICIHAQKRAVLHTTVGGHSHLAATGHRLENHPLSSFRFQEQQGVHPFELIQILPSIYGH